MAAEHCSRRITAAAFRSNNFYVTKLAAGENSGAIRDGNVRVDLGAYNLLLHLLVAHSIL